MTEHPRMTNPYRIEGPAAGINSADVIDCFGDRLICDRCGATVSTYGDRCSAALDVRCPGFEAYDDLIRLTAQTARERRHG